MRIAGGKAGYAVRGGKRRWEGAEWQAAFGSIRVSLAQPRMNAVYTEDVFSV